MVTDQTESHSTFPLAKIVDVDTSVVFKSHFRSIRLQQCSITFELLMATSKLKCLYSFMFSNYNNIQPDRVFLVSTDSVGWLLIPGFRYILVEFTQFLHISYLVNLNQPKKQLFGVSIFSAVFFVFCIFRYFFEHFVLFALMLNQAQSTRRCNIFGNFRRRRNICSNSQKQAFMQSPNTLNFLTN